MQALLAYAEEQVSRKAAAALRRQKRLERARVASREASAPMSLVSKLERRYGRLDAQSPARIPAITFLPFSDGSEVEPLVAADWEVIDLTPLDHDLDPARPGLCIGGQLQIPEADGYRAALRAQAEAGHDYGKIESWAVVMLINADVYRFVYRGPLSRLRQYVTDELSAMLTDWAGIRPGDEIGMPLRIERQ